MLKKGKRPYKNFPLNKKIYIHLFPHPALLRPPLLRPYLILQLHLLLYPALFLPLFLHQIKFGVIRLFPYSAIFPEPRPIVAMSRKMLKLSKILLTLLVLPPKFLKLTTLLPSPNMPWK